jgi:hypothetical protein
MPVSQKKLLRPDLIPLVALDRTSHQPHYTRCLEAEIGSFGNIMKISGPTALVSGANRGLGLCFVETLPEFGAAGVQDLAGDVARNALRGIEAGDINVDTDERARIVRQGLQDDPAGGVAMAWERVAEFRTANPVGLSTSQHSPFLLRD